MITYKQSGLTTLSEPTDTERRIQKTLAIYLDWGRTFCAFNSHLFDWEADMYAITSNGYVREYEIKCDFNDWKNDHLKDKFKTPRNQKDREAYIKEFWYAVPVTLYEKHGLPETLREEAGVLSLSSKRGFLNVQVERKPIVNTKAKPLPPEKMARLYRAAYYKFMTKNVGLRPVAVGDLFEHYKEKIENF